MGADLCSITSIKNESKAVVSCANGTLQIYNWGEFGHPSDMLPGHDPGDLCLARLNEKVVLTGDFRGNIRPVNIQPNRIMGKFFFQISQTFGPFRKPKLLNSKFFT